MSKNEKLEDRIRFLENKLKLYEGYVEDLIEHSDFLEILFSNGIEDLSIYTKSQNDYKEQFNKFFEP